MLHHCELLVAAEDGRRPFSGPDLSETHGFKPSRLSVRSDEIVFDDACVRSSRRNTADQEIGAGRRTGRGHPRRRQIRRMARSPRSRGNGRRDRGVGGSAGIGTGPRPVRSRWRKSLPNRCPRVCSRQSAWRHQVSRRANPWPEKRRPDNRCRTERKRRCSRAGPPPACCRDLPLAMGFNSGKANTLILARMPGPGAVTMLSRPVEKSTKPVAMLTPDRSSPYGLNVANSVGPVLDDTASGT